MSKYFHDNKAYNNKMKFCTKLLCLNLKLKCEKHVHLLNFIAKIIQIGQAINKKKKKQSIVGNASSIHEFNYFDFI